MSFDFLLAAAAAAAWWPSVSLASRLVTNAASVLRGRGSLNDFISLRLALVNYNEHQRVEVNFLQGQNLKAMAAGGAGR